MLLKRRRYHFDMAAVHVRDIPPELLDALKRRAAAHHRSLQGELVEILKQAAAQAPPAGEPAPLRLTLARSSSGGSWRREEIYGDDER